MALPYCAFCHHPPHGNSYPGNPGGCSAIINEFKMTPCNCPTYAQAGDAPKVPKRHITFDTWPNCQFGTHAIDQVDEVEEADGSATITFKCCNHTATLVVPKGGKLQRSLLGLTVVSGTSSTTASPVYAAKAPFGPPTATEKKQEAAPNGEAKYNLLEID